MLCEVNFRDCTNCFHVAKCPVRSPVDNWTKCKENKCNCVQKHGFLHAVIICQKEHKLFFDFEMFNFIF
jgi:hypothetical protein